MTIINPFCCMKYVKHWGLCLSKSKNNQTLPKQT